MMIHRLAATSHSAAIIALITRPRRTRAACDAGAPVTPTKLASFPNIRSLSNMILAAGKPFLWNGAVRAFGNQLAVNDRAAGRELHRQPGIVLIKDNPIRLATQLDLAGGDIAQLMHVLALHQSFSDRPGQFDLVVGIDAVPVVDDDLARARESGFVHLMTGIDHVRIGNGDGHLSRLEP